MAERDRQLRNPPLSAAGWQLGPGLVIAGIIALISSAGLGALIWQWEHGALARLWESNYLRQVIQFSVVQAALSTLLSIVIAVPVARALVRQKHFRGRNALLRLMELSLVLPSIVAVFGIVAVYGRTGWLNTLLTTSGIDWRWNLYGLQGILLAHIFFNAPLAARVMVQTLERIPASHWKIASQLGMTSGAIWRALEWPALKRLIPGLAALVFTLCFTSFAIVMTLGGGPSTTTIEVAIYQALRYEFDFGQAALLAIIQLIICGSLWALASRHGRTRDLLPYSGSSDTFSRVDTEGWHRIRDGALLGLFFVFLIAPILAMALRGVPGLADHIADFRLWSSLARSLLVAIGAGLVSVSFGLAILATSSGMRQRHHAKMAALLEASGHLTLVVPALVLGTGLFILMRPQLGSVTQGLALVMAINALMALPFVIQVLRGPLSSVSPGALRVADQLGIRGLYRWQFLFWPLIRRPLTLALAYAIALSLGDFSIIALFGNPASPTLPMLLYQQLASYQLDAAAGTALLLVSVLAGIFATLQRTGRRLPDVISKPETLNPLSDDDAGDAYARRS
ncbi:thiamine/thiamine pyrophosphate ABC transporter permease [Marinobacter sp. V034]|uniref:thiamine/thiamine pyrophosphate ABC transporter permease n=1 Tax=Marinobacter sp. V034 TaxID=3459610 RepID=UPI0040449223